MEATSTDRQTKRLMKQTSAWDLTCRPPSPEAVAPSPPASRSSRPIQAGVYMLAHSDKPQQVPNSSGHRRYHHNYHQQQQQPQSRIMSPNLAQYQLAAAAAATPRTAGGGPFVVAPHTSHQSLIWDNLSPNKQLQALLASATLAATSSNHYNNNDNNSHSNYSTDITLTPLEWLQQVPRKLDLTRSSSSSSMMNSFDGAAAIADKLYPMTISAHKSFDSSPPPSSYQRHYYQGGDLQQDHHHHHLDHHHRQQASSSSSTSFSLTSSSPVSSTSSSRSSSTESINLSLSKRFISQRGDLGATTNARQLALGSRCQTRLATTNTTTTTFPAALSTSSPSTSGNSSDADYNGTGDISHSNNTSNSAIDARVDRRARKKDQNRRAAYNYRRKKMEERDRMIEEEARLVHKHVRLAGKIALLERKILLILGTETSKVLDEDGNIICYSCPVCLNHSCKDIQTLRNHLKTQHLQQQDILLNGLSAAESQGCCFTRSSQHLDTTTTKTVGEIVGLDDGEEEYDSCTDSDETNNRATYDDLYNDCDAKFVINASLSGDDDNNNIKNSHSF